MFIIKQLHITSIVVILAFTAGLYIARVHLCLHEVEVVVAR